MLAKNYNSEPVSKQIILIFSYYLFQCKKLEITEELPYLDLNPHVFIQNSQQSFSSTLQQLFSLQLPTRIKSLTNLKIAFKQLSQSTLLNFIIPLLRCLFQRSIRRKRQINQKKQSLQAHFLKQILYCYKQISKFMSLSYLFNLLRNLSMKLKNTQDTQNSKIQCKLMCALIQGIPGMGNIFYSCEQQSQVEPNQKSQKLKIFISKLQTYILPSLYNQIKGGESPHIKYFVVIAIYRIISGIDDKQKAQNHLSRLLHILSSALTCRQQLVRNKVRQTLQQFIKILPAQTLYLLFESLSQSLVKGFQRHVLNFTIFQMLQSINLTSKDNSSGQLYAKHIDKCLPYILPTLKEQLFGSLMQQKTTSQSLAAKTYKQAKSSKAIQCFELLSSMIDFVSNAGTLIQPFQDILTSSPTTKQINKCYQVFQVIIQGFSRNKSLESQPALMFIYSLGAKAFEIQHKILQKQSNQNNQEFVSINPKKLTLKQLKADKLAVQQGGGSQRRVSIIRAKHKPKSVLISIQAIQCFSLNLFYQLLQKQKIRFEQFIKNQSIVAEFKDLIFRAIQSKSERVIQTAYKLIFTFLKHNLLDHETKTQLIQHCLQHLNLFDSRYNQDMLQLIVKIINQCLKQQSQSSTQNFCISDTTILEQIITVINYNVQYSEKKVPALFDLIKTIIKLRYVQASIYNLIQVITKIMIQSYDMKTRDVCSDIFLLFFVSYPLEENRLNQHVNFLLKNLNYPGIDGRLQVLKVLRNMITKVGGEILSPSRTQTIFMFLSLQFSNQKQERCREGVVECLKELLGSMDQEILGKVVNTMILWRDDKKSRVFCCRLLRLLLGDVESLGKIVEKRYYTRLVDCCLKDLEVDYQELLECLQKVQEIDRGRAEIDGGENQSCNQKAQILIKLLQDQQSGQDKDEDVETEIIDKNYVDRARKDLLVQIAVILQLVSQLFKNSKNQTKKFVSQKYENVITLIIKLVPNISENFYTLMAGLNVIGQTLEIMVSLTQSNTKKNKKFPKQSQINNEKIKQFLDNQLQAMLSAHLSLFYSNFKSSGLTHTLITNIKILLQFQPNQIQFLVNHCEQVFSLILGDEKIAKIQGLAFIQFIEQVLLHSLLQNNLQMDNRRVIITFILKCIYRVISDEQHYEGSQLMEQCQKLMEQLKGKFKMNQKDLSELMINVRKEIESKRTQRRSNAAQDKILKPEKVALKRIKKNLKKKQLKKQKLDQIRKVK